MYRRVRTRTSSSPRTILLASSSYVGLMPDPHIVEATIYTQRLELHHLAGDRLVTLFEEPESQLPYEGRDYSNPHRVLVDDQFPLHWRVTQVNQDVASNKWFLRWMVLRSSREIVGSTSFHNPPNDVGMLEIGLGVHPDFQGRGYAKEALLGMWSWAVEQPGVSVLRYTVSTTNVASTAIITGFGFAHVGVQVDEKDGPEEIFEMTAREFTQRLKTEWRTP
jgi:[ribosomal protein S5]-alanine N-acetyltransferase